jgi:hypothetical protein
MDDQNTNQPAREPQSNEQSYGSSPVPSETVPELMPVEYASVPDEFEPATSSVQTPQTVASQPFTQEVSPSDVPPAPLVQASPAIEPYQFTPPVPAKKPKKGLLIGGIIAGVLVVLIGAGAAAYQFWYQNPNKVVTDAIMHAIQAKSVIYSGTLATDSDGTKLNLKVSGANATIAQGKVDVDATITTSGKTYTIKSSGVVDKSGTLYIKLTNVRSLLDGIMTQVGIKSTAFDGLIATIDNKWIMISSSDLSTYSQSTAKTQSCLTDAAAKFNTDAASKKELTDAYSKHQFLKIDNNLPNQTISGSDSMGYTITSDDAKLKAFVDQANTSKLVKNLEACDSSIKFDASDFKDTNPTDKTTVHVWVSRWTHELTRLEVTGGSKASNGSLTFDPVFNMPVTVDTPKDALTLKQIQDEFTKAITAYEQDAYANYYSTQGTTGITTAPSTPGV